MNFVFSKILCSEGATQFEECLDELEMFHKKHHNHNKNKHNDKAECILVKQKANNPSSIEPHQNEHLTYDSNNFFTRLNHRYFLRYF